MNKITDKINKYTTDHDVAIWQSLCDSCAERHLPNWQVGMFCMQDMVPRLRQRVRRERKATAIRALRADGFTVKEIAGSLKISERTVMRALKGGNNGQ